MVIHGRLRQKIKDVLLSFPNIYSIDARYALAIDANLDSDLTHSIDFSGPAARFVELFIKKLIDYGKLHDGGEPLEAVIEAIEKTIAEGNKERLDSLYSLKEEMRVFLQELRLSQKGEITFNIAGGWLATDFITLFTAIQNIYIILLKKSQPIEEIKQEIPIPLSLTVKRIEYASPGLVNFEGLGEPIEALLKLIQGLVLLPLIYREKKKEIEQKEAQEKHKRKLEERELRAKDVENSKQELQLQKEQQGAEIVAIKDRIEIRKEIRELAKQQFELRKNFELNEEMNQAIESVTQELLNITSMIEEGKLLPIEQESSVEE